MQSSQSILDPFSVKWRYSESIYNFFLQNSRNWQLHRKSHNRGLGWPFVLCLNLVLHWTGENIKTQASHHAKQHTGCGQQNNNKKQRTEERKKEKTDIKQATSVNLHHNINLHWSGIYCKMHCVPTDKTPITHAAMPPAWPPFQTEKLLKTLNPSQVSRPGGIKC